jgi:hypothetical protein
MSNAEDQNKEPEWRVDADGRTLHSNKFDHDVMLAVHGDFECAADRIAYAKRIAMILNDEPQAKIDALMLEQTDITPEQIEEWSKHQVPAGQQEPVADAMTTPSNPPPAKPPEWVYRTDLGKWIDLRSGRIGRPQKGDWYKDGDEWRIR